MDRIEDKETSYPLQHVIEAGNGHELCHTTSVSNNPHLDLDVQVGTAVPVLKCLGCQKVMVRQILNLLNDAKSRTTHYCSTNVDANKATPRQQDGAELIDDGNSWFDEEHLRQISELIGNLQIDRQHNIASGKNVELSQNAYAEQDSSITEADPSFGIPPLDTASHRSSKPGARLDEWEASLKPDAIGVRPWSADERAGDDFKEWMEALKGEPILSNFGPNPNIMYVSLFNGHDITGAIPAPDDSHSNCAMMARSVFALFSKSGNVECSPCDRVVEGGGGHTKANSFARLGVMFDIEGHSKALLVEFQIVEDRDMRRFHHTVVFGWQYRAEAQRLLNAHQRARSKE